MVGSIALKTVGDRWRGTVIGAGTIGLFLLAGMAAYREIDLEIYQQMPEVFLSLIGIPPDADVAVLTYAAVYGFYGALVLSSIALSMGSASMAGEERDGTAGLLLGNPRSRRQVLASKSVAIVALTSLGAFVLWLAGLGAPALLDVSTTGMHVGALIAHLLAIALFHGFLAMAIGAWTGRRSLASGITAGVMAVSFVAVGVLPLFEGLEELAKLFPWYYLDGGQPATNGVQWGHVALLLGGAVALGIAALVGVERRDLRGRESGTTMIDRLRAHPMTDQWFERLAGSTRVSAIWVKTTSEHQGLALVSGMLMFWMMGVLMGPMYAAIDPSVLAFANELPEVLVAMIGGADMSTPEGWYVAETFSLMAPMAVMAVTVTVGARALGGEEANGTMSLLLTNPIRRSRVVLEKTAAMVVLATGLGTATFGGVMSGSLLAGLGLDVGNVAATSTLVTLLGLVFGALALAISAAVGRVRTAVYGAVGAALAAYLLDSFLPFSDRLASLARLSPFGWYLGSDPMTNGMDWGHAGLLSAAFLVLVAASVVLFQRRDLRQG